MLPPSMRPTSPPMLDWPLLLCSSAPADVDELQMATFCAYPTSPPISDAPSPFAFTMLEAETLPRLPPFSIAPTRPPPACDPLPEMFTVALVTVTDHSEVWLAMLVAEADPTRPPTRR